jgi:hypothetical protein
VQPVCKSVSLTGTPSLCLLNSSSRLDQYCRRKHSSAQPPMALTRREAGNNVASDTELVIKPPALATVRTGDTTSEWRHTTSEWRHTTSEWRHIKREWQTFLILLVVLWFRLQESQLQLSDCLFKRLARYPRLTDSME